jgi:hypothetical protein
MPQIPPSKTDPIDPAKLRPVRWLKRILLTLGVLTLLAGIVVGVAWHRASRVPDWYAAAKPGAVATAEQPLLPTQNWAARTSAGNVDAKPAEAKAHTLELTDQQINTLLMKWSDAAGVSRRLGDQFEDLRVRLADGKITLAGRSPEYGRVVSVVVEPEKRGEGVALRLAGIFVGDQRLPLVAMNDQQSQLRGGVARRVKAARDQLAIDGHGIATPKTSEIYYTTVAADLLAGRAAEAFAFLNFQPLGDAQDTVATRVTGLSIDQGKLRMEIRMLTGDERAKLVETLRDYGASAKETTTDAD